MISLDFVARAGFRLSQPPMEYMGRGGGTNFGLYLRPIHFARTLPRMTSAIASSGAPLPQQGLHVRLPR